MFGSQLKFMKLQEGLKRNIRDKEGENMQGKKLFTILILVILMSSSVFAVELDGALSIEIKEDSHVTSG